MARQISPYLSFDGNCREAMNFYKESIGGELTLQTVGESPIAGQMPPALKDSIMHSTLTTDDGLVFMGSDMHRDKLVDGNTVHMCINCGSEEEINSLFTNLSRDGKITEPLVEMFWGGLYGSLTDKFGKNWVFNYQKNRMDNG